MPSFNRPLLPGFLKRLDNYLLKNKPDIWTTRVHLTVWYSLLTTITLCALYYLANGDARTARFERSWMPYISTICAVGLIVYVIYVVRFNVFKRFGNLKIAKHGALQFIYITIAIGSIGLPAVVPNITEAFWAHQQYTKSEIIKDARAINFQYHLLDQTLGLNWNSTRIKVVSDTNDAHLVYWMSRAEYNEKLRRDSIAAMQPNATTIGPNNNNAIAVAEAVVETMAAEAQDYQEKFFKTWLPYVTRNQADLEKTPFGEIDAYVHQSIIDSILKQKDSIINKGNGEYILYDCPNLHTCNAPFSRDEDYRDSDSASAMQSSKKIYDALNAYQKPLDFNKELTKFDTLCNKYITPLALNEIIESNSSGQIDRKDAMIRAVENSMDNIATKMDQASFRNIFIRFNFILIGAMCLSVLLLIFRHSTPRAFWLSALSFILLFILTVLIADSTRSFNNPQFVLFAYSLLFILIAFSTYSATRRTLFHGIGINIAVLALCALPTLIFSVITTMAQEALQNAESMHIYTPTQNEIIAQLQARVDTLDRFTFYLPLVTLIICIALFAFVIAPLYKKWYSMPSN
jgi:hypothetical protein